MARKPVRIDETRNEGYKLLSFHLPTTTTTTVANTSKHDPSLRAINLIAVGVWRLALRTATNISSAINTTELQLKLIYDDISLIKKAVMRMKPRCE